MFERKFSPKRDEVTGNWRKLHIEENHSLHSSPHIITTMKSRKMRWAVNVEGMGVVEKLGGTRPLGR